MLIMSKTSTNDADGEANWSGVVNFHCMQMRPVLSVRFIFGDNKNDVRCHAHHIFLLSSNVVISL